MADRDNQSIITNVMRLRQSYWQLIGYDFHKRGEYIYFVISHVPLIELRRMKGLSRVGVGVG